jgi:hypothetical protein
VTAVLERVPVDRISLEARDVHAGRVLLTVFAALFFAVGWTVAKAWLTVAWCGVAVKVGWLEARKSTGGPHGPAR